MTTMVSIRKAVACLALVPAASGIAQVAPEPLNKYASALSPVLVTGAQTAERDNGVLGEPVSPFSAPVDLRTIPASVLHEPGIQSLSSALDRDASVGENYATSGYYQNFTIRGFTLDLGSAYRINGFVVPGEFDIPLDNMASVEILEGIAGLHGGSVGAGGTVNFVTRRPGAPNFVRAEVEPRGGRLATLDAGSAPVVGDGSTGWAIRMNATHADLRPEQPHADGHRDLLSAAIDARLLPNLMLQADVIAQHRSQPAVPGFQLLGGTTLPDLSFSDVNINRQPWSRPVTNKGVMADVRADWQLSDRLWMEGGVAETVVSIDDNLATPSGCNSAPVQYFCSNGDYVLYDYHANERRSGGHVTATLHGLGDTGPLAHGWSVGIERIDRRIQQSDLYSATTYDDIGNALTGNLRTTATPLPAPVGVGVDLPRQRATQTAAFMSDRLGYREVALLVAVRLVEILQQPADARERRTLPQLAATWHFMPGQMVYASAAGNVEFGSEAPLIASNAGTLLAPRSTRQVEVGWKGMSEAGSEATAAVFTMRRPYEFTLPVGTSYAGLGDYVRAGMQTSTGISVGGKTSPRGLVQLEGSIALLAAKARNTGNPADDGVQIQNVPRISSFLRATCSPASLPVRVHLDWSEKGRRNARRDGLGSAPGYGVIDAGAEWHGTAASRSLTLAMTIRNVANKTYWRDVGEAYSADLLFPGAARSVAVSAIVDF